MLPDGAQLARLKTLHGTGRMPAIVRVRGRLIDIQKKVIPNFPVYILGPFGVRLKTTTDAKGEFKISIEFVSSNPKKESQQAPTWVFWYPRVTAKSDTQCPWDLWSRASSSAGFEEQGGSHGSGIHRPAFGRCCARHSHAGTQSCACTPRLALRASSCWST